MPPPLKSENSNAEVIRRSRISNVGQFLQLPITDVGYNPTENKMFDVALLHV